MRFGLIVFLVLFGFLNFGQAETSKYSYITQSSAENAVAEVGYLQVLDNPATLGEEEINWVFKSNNSKLNVESVSGDSYEASLFVEYTNGEILHDLGFALLFKNSYEVFKTFMADESFRSSFDEIPKDCDDNAVGILILTDNLLSKQSAYCLSKN